MVELDNFVSVLAEKELQEGSMKLLKIQGLPILLIKQAGQIYAIDNRCPHMGCAFSGGTLNGTKIVCPCHDWRFDIQSGRFLDAPELALAVYPVKTEAGKVFVSLG